MARGTLDLLLLLSFALLVLGSRPARARGCNKTIRTARIIGSPRLSVSNRGQPIHCTYRLTPPTGDPRDVFEVAFRQFNIPSSEPGSLYPCSSTAYLSIADAGRPPSQVGTYCGHLASRRHRRFFLSPARSGDLLIEFHADKFGPATKFEAAVSALPRRFAIERHKELALPEPGVPLSPWNTLCDRLFLNCRGPCDITSPGYPGFYPRNVTCRHRVVVNETEGGRIAVGGQYFDVFDVGTPGPQPARSRSWRRKWNDAEVTVDACPGDYVAVRDWREGASSEEVARFCGRGLFPSVVARGRAVILEFHSSPWGTLDHDGFYLTVGSIVPGPSPRVGEVMPQSGCFWKLSGDGEHSQGDFHSLAHWYTPGTECTYLLEGKPGQRVRIFFSAFEENGNTCEDDRLTLYDGGELVGSYCNGDKASKTKNRLKGMVRDSVGKGKRKKGGHPAHGKPLSPSQSYVSKGDVVRLLFHSEGGSFDGRQFVYTVSYAFLDAKRHGNQMLVDSSGCQMEVKSEDGGSGPFALLADRLPLLLATKRDTKNWGSATEKEIFDEDDGEDANDAILDDSKGSVDCNARFVGRTGERVKLEFHKVSFGRNRSISLTVCESEDFPIRDDVIYVSDGGRIPRHIGCLRDTSVESSNEPFVFYSSGNVMSLRLQLHRISPSAYTDLYSYRFEGIYHFQRADSGCGDSTEVSQSGHHGVIRFPPTSDADDPIPEEGPLHCSWAVQVTTGRQPILKLQYLFLPPNCELNRITIRFFGDSASESELILCRENATSVVEALPPWWGHPWPSGVERRGASVELTAASARSNLRFAFRWSEVSPKKLSVREVGVWEERDNPDCDFECPDGVSCLSVDALCDGSIDCPQTNFTGLPLDERCEGVAGARPGVGAVDPGAAFAAQWVLFVAASVGVACVALLLALSVLMLMPRRRRAQKFLLRTTRDVSVK